MSEPRDLSMLTDEQHKRLTVLIGNIRNVLNHVSPYSLTPQEALEKITDLIQGRGNPIETADEQDIWQSRPADGKAGNE